MKKGITVEQEYTESGAMRAIVRKSRGKLTVEEIQDALRESVVESGGGCYHFVVIIKATEDTGYQGWMDDEDRGDTVELWEIFEGDTCPVCGQLTPPFDNCPNCGVAWRDLR